MVEEGRKRWWPRKTWLNNMKDWTSFSILINSSRRKTGPHGSDPYNQSSWVKVNE
jgi:hypothetical protein